MSPAASGVGAVDDVNDPIDASYSSKFIPPSVFEAVEVRATAAEKKASHLNSLLGETESENARLSQLATVLKVCLKTTASIHVKFLYNI